MTESLLIANTQAFWGDRTDASSWMLSLEPSLDYITLDYLAEVSMGIMAIQREKDPKAGYAKDFIEVIRSLIPYWKDGGKCRVIANAGGLNPEGCAEACRKVLQEAGIEKTIGVVTGDDVMGDLDSVRNLTIDRDKIVSANAYLGAKPIVEVLKTGVDIVITGRIADPSLVVAPCIHTFGWNFDDYDKIAQATVAGHLIECGTQVCGGISTNWMELEQYTNIGYPIIEMQGSGEFVVTKPKEADGRVSIETVKEQLLYEIGDPDQYLSPDVTVSFLGISLEQLAKDRIRVTGAKGKNPPETYKVSVTYHDGYKAEGSLVVSGPKADLKAKRVAEVIYADLDLERHHEEFYGDSDKGLLRFAVADHNRSKVVAWTKRIAPLVTAGPQGITGYTSGRPKVRPIFGFTPGSIPVR